jgi:hypothetical protein
MDGQVGDRYGCQVGSGWFKSDRITSSPEFKALPASVQEFMNRETIPHFPLFHCSLHGGGVLEERVAIVRLRFPGENQRNKVAAGSLDTPKILMHSGIGPAADLEKFDIPVVNDLP